MRISKQSQRRGVMVQIPGQMQMPIPGGSLRHRQLRRSPCRTGAALPVTFDLGLYSVYPGGFLCATNKALHLLRRDTKCSVVRSYLTIVIISPCLSVYRKYTGEWNNSLPGPSIVEK
ncbi:hypothetical protein BDBG_01966, partial [Blastomyces gilchristii SLH14081]